MSAEQQPRSEHPRTETALSERQVGSVGMVPNVEEQRFLDGCAHRRMSFDRLTEQGPTHGAPPGRYAAMPWQQRQSFYARELTLRRTNRVTGLLGLFRKEIGDREVALPSVVIESEDAGVLA